MISSLQLIRATRWIGTSLDTKPTANIHLGSEFYETDTSILYIYSGTEWVVKSSVAISRGHVWNPSTLDWEAEKQTEVTIGELTVSGVAVSNLPSTFSYKLSDMATGSDPSYFGYVDAAGNWYIMKLTDSTGQARYVKGASGYTTAWTGRAGLTYGYYDAIF